MARDIVDSSDGLLTEDELYRLRIQAELSLEIREREHDLDIQMRTDEIELRQREADQEHRFQLRRELDQAKLEDDRWHRGFDRFERWHQFWPLLIRTWLVLTAPFVLPLAAYVCWRAGLTPTGIWHSLFR